MPSHTAAERAKRKPIKKAAPHAQPLKKKRPKKRK